LGFRAIFQDASEAKLELSLSQDENWSLFALFAMPFFAVPKTILSLFYSFFKRKRPIICPKTGI
jgi:hypothetical protein